MEYVFASLLLFMSCFTVHGQDFTSLKTIPLNDSVQCKNAEAKVLECDNYLLAHPGVENMNTINAALFLLNWMDQTLDHSFHFNKLYKVVKDDSPLAGIYLACQPKLAITENWKEYNDAFDLKFSILFLDYCEDPANRVTITPKLKKFIEAKNKGKLREMLVE